MPHYMSGSLEDRMKTDPDFGEAERLVRELELEYNNIAKPLVTDLEGKAAGLKGSFAEAGRVQRAEDELGRARQSLNDLHERLKRAWNARDELLGVKPAQNGESKL
jgi:hypothetical protein